MANKYIKSLKKMKDNVNDIEIRINDIQDRVYDLVGAVAVLENHMNARLLDIQDLINDVQPRLIDVQDRVYDIKGMNKDVQDQIHDIRPRLQDTQDRVYDIKDLNSDINIRTRDIQNQIHDIRPRLQDTQDRVYDIYFGAEVSDRARQDIGAKSEIENAEILENIESFKVFRRADKLGITKEQLIDSKEKINDFYNNYSEVEKPKKTDVFKGNKTSELNKFMKKSKGNLIRVENNELSFDECINVVNNTHLLFDSTIIQKGNSDHVVLIENADNVSIEGLIIEKCKNGILIVESANVSVTNCKIKDMQKRPVVVGDSHNIQINNNIIANNGEGGIYIGGDSYDCIVENNEIFDNYGTSNWMAGIVLSSVEVSDYHNIDSFFDGNLHFPKKAITLEKMLKSPHRISVTNNQVYHNNSSGIYCEGAYNCFIVENTVDGNDKEGMCLDYGALGVYVLGNILSNNGSRSRQTTKDLDMDFVGVFGLLNDNSSPAKLPGISLDNTMWNTISENRLISNAGSGIKAVRSAISNDINMNIVKDNNVGQSDEFHFFGIELGAAISDIDEDTTMDFKADFNNIVTDNIISGNHYSAVYLALGCENNVIVGNICKKMQYNKLEDLSSSKNIILNNVG